MTKFSTTLLAGAALVGLTAAAQAADMGVPLRGPQVLGTMADPGSSGASGWYLRGDIGIGINSGSDLDSSGSEGVTALGGRWLRKDIADTPFISAGLGYQFTDYLRGDVTFEYRSATRFRGNAIVPDTAPGGVWKYPYYDGQFQVFDTMVNGYVDLGNYYGLTPYVGAGIGAAYVKMGDVYEHTSFQPAGTMADGMLPSSSKWNFAWALHTGVSWDVNPRLKLEMGYTYKSLGDIKSAELQCNTNTGVTTNCNEWISIKHLASNDLHLGMRWLLDPKEAKAPVYAPMPTPVVAKY